MIQPTALVSPLLTSPVGLSPVAVGDGAAFALPEALAVALPAAGQALAAPGSDLPPTPSITLPGAANPTQHMDIPVAIVAAAEQVSTPQALTGSTPGLVAATASMTDVLLVLPPAAPEPPKAEAPPPSPTIFAPAPPPRAPRAAEPASAARRTRTTAGAADDRSVAAEKQPVADPALATLVPILTAGGSGEADAHPEPDASDPETPHRGSTPPQVSDEPSAPPQVLPDTSHVVALASTETPATADPDPDVTVVRTPGSATTGRQPHTPAAGATHTNAPIGNTADRSSVRPDEDRSEDANLAPAETAAPRDGQIVRPPASSSSASAQPSVSTSAGQASRPKRDADEGASSVQTRRSVEQVVPRAAVEATNRAISRPLQPAAPASAETAAPTRSVRADGDGSITPPGGPAQIGSPMPTKSEQGQDQRVGEPAPDAAAEVPAPSVSRTGQAANASALPPVEARAAMLAAPTAATPIEQHAASAMPAAASRSALAHQATTQTETAEPRRATTRVIDLSATDTTALSSISSLHSTSAPAAPATAIADAVPTGSTAPAAPPPSTPTRVSAPSPSTEPVQAAAPVAQVGTPASTATPPAPALQVVPALPEPQAASEPRRIASAAVDIAPVRVASQPSEAPPLIAGMTAPAFRLFAAAIHAARADERDPSPTGQVAPAAPATPVHAAPAIADARGAALDMTDRRWPHAMVERIESLRDAASAAKDAASTSIRLVPDALGAIDVKVRTQGDTVHVHFAADQAATRTMLADAQPRLAEIAESRGLKLAQGDVGSGGQQQRQPERTATPLPAAPRSAARDDEPQTATTRVA